MTWQTNGLYRSSGIKVRSCGLVRTGPEIAGSRWGICLRCRSGREHQNDKILFALCTILESEFSPGDTAPICGPGSKESHMASSWPQSVNPHGFCDTTKSSAVEWYSSQPLGPIVKSWRDHNTLSSVLWFKTASISKLFSFAWHILLASSRKEVQQFMMRGSLISTYWYIHNYSILMKVDERLWSLEEGHYLNG